MSVMVRAASPQEYDVIGDLTARAYLADGLIPQGSDYQDTLRKAADRAQHSELLVAWDDEAGQVLGTVSFVRAGSAYADVAREGEAEFRMLAVDPAARGLGLGRVLVEECVARARAAGARRLVLSTRSMMTPAVGLYESMGFVRRPERDWEPMAGVLLMTYELELG
ncbi:GNAT family N-acetyltransferase [Angustibacter sp. McL0619]|uniref:GNAT family N-acetyltransferase n=1 Tax=Angustibacter sp. McL0619 TaxID=3415676 RepID=UPI003CF8869B